MHKEHPPTSQLAYRLLRQVMRAAVDDNRISSSPCRVKGAGVDRSPERQIATLAEVEVIVENMPERLALLPLLATYAGLRRSELLGLRRRDVDIVHRSVSVVQTIHHLADGSVLTKGPKTAAGRRTVAFGTSIADDVNEHLARFVGPEPDALVFTGDKGGPLNPLHPREGLQEGSSSCGPGGSVSPRSAPHQRHAGGRHRGDPARADAPDGPRHPHSALRYLHATKDRDRVVGEALADLRPNAPVVDLPARREGS